MVSAARALLVYLFVFKIFLIWTIFEVFIEFVTILLLFYALFSVWFFFFWPRSMEDPSSLTRDRTRSPFIGRQSPNPRTTREVPGSLFYL